MPELLGSKGTNQRLNDQPAPNSKQNTPGVLGSRSFSTFIRQLDNETKYTASVFLLGIELGMWLTTNCRISTWRNL